jgi:hypothetical protein
MSWEFAHGLVEYKSDYTVYEIVDLAANNGIKYIRLTLEKTGAVDKSSTLEEVLFQDLCYKLETGYPQITFFNGRAKKGWRLLYLFKTDPEIEQYVSSMKGKWLTRVIPWLYAKLNNRKNLNLRNSNIINLYDFLS